MQRKWMIIGLVVVGIPALAIGWWLGSPLFLDTEVSEEFPMSASAAIPDGMSIEDVEAEMVKAAAEADAVVADEMPATGEPLVLGSGSFAGADDLHQGSGTATVYELEDGSRVLRFEAFDVTNGPDLRVILTPAESVSGREDVMADGYVELGALKGNIGDQNYDIPAGLNLGEYHTVVIYCMPFHVVFATANLAG